MIPLILFILLIILIIVLTEIRERKKANGEATTQHNQPEDGCCGQHLVCERETLLQTNAKIEYYDDEELDALADTDPSQYTVQQHDAILHVFNTLLEKDVPGWCRSLQLRHIQLPNDIREEALMIVRERRHM
ncbi:MAG: phospholipase [Paludibacteraceae bacterium]|nr:phospholipase [Paludibacteraceae bacterium]